MLVLEVLIPPVIVKLSPFLILFLALMLFLVVDHHLEFSVELLLLLAGLLQHHRFPQVALLFFLLALLVGDEDVKVIAVGLLEGVLIAHGLVELFVVFRVVDPSCFLDLSASPARHLSPAFLLVLPKATSTRQKRSFC